MKVKKIAIDDFEIKGSGEEEIPHITWAEEEYQQFSRWMIGQTCVPQGVYPWDVQNYLHKRHTGREMFWD